MSGSPTRADWAGVDFWFTDERCVPPDHEHSNFRMADGPCSSRARAPRAPHEGRARPARGGGRTSASSRRRAADFDLILLGIGPDAHTCSLFPGDEALGEHDRAVVGVETPGMAPLVSRITLTLPVVNALAAIVFLVTGQDKADAVARPSRRRPTRRRRPRWSTGR